MEDSGRQGTLQGTEQKSVDDHVPLMRSREGTMDRKVNGGGEQPEKAKRRSGPPVECNVSMPDGSICTVEISKNSIGQDLLDSIFEKLNLLEKDYFGCTYKKRDVKFWLKNEKPISKQIKGLSWQFSFDVKFYPLDPTQLREELTRYQMYLQVRDDITSGKLPCSFVTLALLGSYAVQSQLGDYETDEHGTGIEYIKKIRFAPSQSEELLDKIAELHRTHRGQLPAEAELHYLENAKAMSLYGVHMHPATECTSGDKVSVGVCAAGLMIFNERIRVHRFVWAKIIMISYKRNCFIVKIRQNPGETIPANELIHKYKLENLVMAKRLWRLAVEHHGFFRLREPDIKDIRKRFSRAGSKYRYRGPTQYQSQQAAEMISRSSQNFNVNRGVTGDRFVWDRTLDPSTPGFSVDRSEEVVAGGYRTATLDLNKRRNKNPLAFADGEDDGSGDGMIQTSDTSGRVVYIKTTHPSTSSGDVFLTLSGQRRPSQENLAGDGRTPGAGYGPGSYENINMAGRTPWPGGPNGPGYVTPDTMGYGPPGYGTPGTPQYGIDDLHRQHSTDYIDNQYYQNAGYGTARTDNRMAGTPGADMGGGRPGYNYQEDYLRQQQGGGQYGIQGPDGQWLTTTTTVKTTTRTYTAADGTLVTERRTEKDGIVETHIENRKSVDLDMDSDYDKALSDAILSVTDVDQNLSVAKIEIRRDD